MKRRRRSADIFSLSFLDVVTCGFGAIVLLLLVTKSGFTVSDDNTDVSALLNRTFQTEDSIQRLSDRLEQLRRELDEDRARNKDALVAQSAREAELKKKQAAAADLKNERSGLEAVRETMKRASISRDTATERDREVAGIPVDSNYVIFIIDTSGSMQAIWARVMQTVENILDIHPKVRGFQILNDNGVYLISAYKKKWIPDTPRRRKSILNAVQNWGAISNSSPVEGLEVALQDYAGKQDKISIYIFGDDYTGPSYDAVIKTLERLNTDRISGKPIVRVHAIGFVSPQNHRFGTLMREVAGKNNGVFLALPP
ncbi:MAG: hypothetical protein OXU50_06455 [Gammaproteobacteria bacterium]|nr:hypothetical protein [Gammaproteobacteria bacterium]